MRNDDADESRLRGIAFIQLPAALAGELSGLGLDPAAPIPVETGGDPSRFRPEELTREAIVAGMLRVLAWRPDDPNAPGWRRFVLAVRPEILGELSEAGVAKARNGDFEVAEEVFLALAGLFPERAEPLSNLAVVLEDRSEAYEKLGNETLAEEFRERAHEVYRRLLAFEPPYAEAFFNAGYFHLRLRSYERAREFFETYLKLGSDETRLARAREIAGRLERQGFLDTLFKEAYDFISMGREEEGVAKAREFLEAYPRVWNGWFLVGWGNRRLSRWTEGRDAFLKALELGADDADTLNELAICLMESGDHSGARKRLEEALRREPENVKIIANLGGLSIRQGRKEDAKGYFRVALELDPSDEISRRALESLEHA